jgi:hypothetical protein
MPTSFTQDPSTLGGGYVYCVLFDYAYSTFVANNYRLPDGTDYDIISFSYYLQAQGSPPSTAQEFYPGVLRTDNDLSVVPEPTTFALIATGMGVVLVRRRRKQTGNGEESA